MEETGGRGYGERGDSGLDGLFGVGLERGSMAGGVMARGKEKLCMTGSDGDRGGMENGLETIGWGLNEQARAGVDNGGFSLCIIQLRAVELGKENSWGRKRSRRGEETDCLVLGGGGWMRSRGWKRSRGRKNKSECVWEGRRERGRRCSGKSSRGSGGRYSKNGMAGLEGRSNVEELWGVGGCSGV
ncbi:unnamed protein product [Calypogeia fissa]